MFRARITRYPTPGSTAVSDAELDGELSAAKVRIETETGVICDTIAYPNGTNVAESACRHSASRLSLWTDPTTRHQCSGRRSVRPAPHRGALYNEYLGTFICRVTGL